MVVKKVLSLSFGALLISSLVSYGANQLVRMVNTPDVTDARNTGELIPFLSGQLGLKNNSLKQKALSDAGIVVEADVKNSLQLRSVLFNASQIKGVSVRKVDFSRMPEGAFKLVISFIF